MPASPLRSRQRSRSRQLTVRGVESRLGQAIELEARRRGLSVNRCVLVLLAEILGVEPSASPRKPVRYSDLDHLAGTWSVREADQFDVALREQRTIDEKLWR